MKLSKSLNSKSSQKKSQIWYFVLFARNPSLVEVFSSRGYTEVKALKVDFKMLKFSQTDVRWDEQTCLSQQIKAFPESSVPPYFSFNGTVKLGYRLCDQWIWRTGGHNPGQATSLTAYYIANKTNDASGANEDPHVPVMDPVMLEIMSNSGPIGKTSQHLNINITSFLAGEADEELLKLPDFCKT